MRAAPPEQVAQLMEAAQRSTAARALPRKALSAAVAKALQLARAFPSLSPRELLVRPGLLLG